MESDGPRSREPGVDTPTGVNRWLVLMTPVAGLIAAIAALITAIRS